MTPHDPDQGSSQDFLKACWKIFVVRVSDYGARGRGFDPGLSPGIFAGTGARFRSKIFAIFMFAMSKSTVFKSLHKQKES